MATVFIPDITELSKEEWRKERKKGIGGSDVGAILGLNDTCQNVNFCLCGC